MLIYKTPFNTLKSRSTKIKKLLSAYAERHPDITVAIHYGDIENGKTSPDEKPIIGKLERYETPRKPVYVVNTREGRRVVIEASKIVMIRDLQSRAWIYTHPKHVFYKGELY